MLSFQGEIYKIDYILEYIQFVKNYDYLLVKIRKNMMGPL